MIDSIREKRDPISVVYDINNNAIWLKVGSVKTLSILQYLKDQFPRLPKSKFPLLYGSLEDTAEYYVNVSPLAYFHLDWIAHKASLTLLLTLFFPLSPFF